MNIISAFTCSFLGSSAVSQCACMHEKISNLFQRNVPHNFAIATSMRVNSLKFIPTAGICEGLTELIECVKIEKFEDIRSRQVDNRKLFISIDIDFIAGNLFRTKEICSHEKALGFQFADIDRTYAVRENMVVRLRKLLYQIYILNLLSRELFSIYLNCVWKSINKFM